MSGFLTPLRIEDAGPGNGGRQVFVLLESFEYEVGAVGSGLIIRVPAGFATDFASIPRFFWRIAPPMGEHGKAAVLHDYLYKRSVGFSKLAADAIFYEAMEVLGVSWWRREVMYWAVRWFGRSRFQWEEQPAKPLVLPRKTAEEVHEIQEDIASVEHWKTQGNPTQLS